MLLNIIVIFSSRFSTHTFWHTLTLTFNRAAPLVMGNQDKHFLLDEEPASFPKFTPFASFFVTHTLARRHSNLWRFNPSNIYGTPRNVPIPPQSKLESNKKEIGEGAIVAPPVVVSKKSLSGFLGNVQMILLVLVMICFALKYLGLLDGGVVSLAGFERERLRFANYSLIHL